MKFSPSEVLQAAEAIGFKADMVEKVLHLLNLLNTLNSHPFLKVDFKDCAELKPP